MHDNLQNTTLMQSDIDSLRERFPRTADLYKEACAVMFFRYGVTPTTNSLYQLVRKGSMSAPSEALKSFWTDLRQRARVDLQHANLPNELKQSAGQLIGKIWLLAQKASDESLAALRQTAAIERDAAIAENKHLEEKIIKFLAQAQGDADQLESANEIIEKQRGDLGLATVAEQETNLKLDKARAANETLRDQINSLLSARAAETESLTSRVLLAEQQYADLAKRTLVDLDRERTSATKLQKLLDVERRTSTSRVKEIQSEVQRAQLELARQGRDIAGYMTKVELLADERDRAMGRAASAGLQCQELESQLAAERARVAELRTQIERLGSAAKPGLREPLSTPKVLRQRRRPDTKLDE